MTVMMVITLMPGPSWFDLLDRSYWRVAAPEPYQAGVADPWVVHLPQGRWSTRMPIRIVPLEHPVFPIA